jgi:hypothetical protein
LNELRAIAAEVGPQIVGDDEENVKLFLRGDDCHGQEQARQDDSAQEG